MVNMVNFGTYLLDNHRYTFPLGTEGKITYTLTETGFHMFYIKTLYSLTL